MGTRGEGQGIDSLITLWGESVPVFTVTGDIDPFLHVSLRKGEKIYCESDAMVMMEATLDLKGKMSGGLGRALARRLVNGESFFQSVARMKRSGIRGNVPGFHFVPSGLLAYCA